MRNLQPWILKFWILFYATILLADFLYAQNGITTYPLPAGYTPSQLKYKTDLATDHSSHVWLGFRDVGLGVFDGFGWVMYNDTNSMLPSNRINCLAIDGTNRIWAGTPKGLVTYDGNTWSLYTKSNSMLPDDSIISLYSHQNNTWIGTTKGAVKFDGNSWSLFTTSNSGLVNDTVLSFAEDSHGKIWIGTKNGLCVFDNSNWITYDSLNSGLKQRVILALAINSKDEIWISAINYNGGSVLYFFKDNQFLNYKMEIYNDALDFNLNHYLLQGFNKSCLKLRYNDHLIFISDKVYEINKEHITLFNKIFYANAFSFRFDIDQNGLLWFANESNLLGSFNFDQYHNFGLGIDNSNTRNLDCNKVKAMMLNRGDMCWDLINSKYEVPKGSGKTSIFASALWIGGLDAADQLHFGAQTYRQSGCDFWPGPIDTVSKVADTLSCLPYDRIWKLNRYDVEEFIYHSKKGDLTGGSYTIPEDLLSWPAHGAGNLSKQLAPFVDTDGDGLYNALKGDYPSIKGDQALYWIFNDNLSLHTETDGNPLGFEFHVMAYAYNCPDIADSLDVINTTTFYHYEIINRSGTDYHDCYAGIWTDTDLGNATDDYVGCDTLLQSGYSYNGDNNDEGAYGYGLNPPIINAVILKGPEAAPNDGLDNDKDGITDEENEFNGISHFMFYGGGSGPTDNPTNAPDFYYYLQSKWLDSLKLTYGENGRNPANPPTNFMFSGTPYDTIGWTEFNSGNIPEDRRFIESSGPFSLAAGEHTTLDFAFVWTRDSLHPNGLTTSIARNKSDLQKIHDWFNTNSFPTCLKYEFPPIPPEATQIAIFPNPAHEYIELPDGYLGMEKELEVFDITGRLCFRQQTLENKIQIKTLTRGMYFLRITIPGKKFIGKFCKM